MGVYGNVGDDGKWILEIDGFGGRTTSITKEHGYFHTIGVGGTVAQTVMQTYRMMEHQDLKTGKLLMYRILEDTTALAEHVEEPIHIHTIDSRGGVSEIGAEEKRSFKEICINWRERERGLLAEIAKEKGPSWCPMPE